MLKRFKQLAALPAKKCTIFYRMIFAKFNVQNYITAGIRCMVVQVLESAYISHGFCTSSHRSEHLTKV